MSKHDDGGPAFPISEWHLSCTENGNRVHPDWRGMTLRDYFAAKALHGFCADPHIHSAAAKIARTAYDVADAMLAARGGNDGR
jgi:hypothetical protein